MCRELESTPEGENNLLYPFLILNVHVCFADFNVSDFPSASETISLDCNGVYIAVFYFTTVVG
jgi:hypothetical protein